MEKLRILVIEDEEMVRDVLSRLLRRIGAEVVAERRGEDGLRRYDDARASGRGFDAVFVDLTMTEGMGGEATVRELLRIDPDCRAIVCSGHTDDPAVVDFEEHGFRGRVSKPFRLEDLRRALRDATGWEIDEQGASG